MAISTVIFCLVCSILYHIDYKCNKYYIVLGLFISIILIMLIDMFSYTAIYDNEIIVKENIIKDDKKYKWSEVDYLNTDYYYVNRHKTWYADFSCVLIMRDGYEIDLKNSQQFKLYDKVLYFMKSLKVKGIKINRRNINSIKFNDLCKDSNFKRYATVIFSELFNVVD